MRSSKAAWVLVAGCACGPACTVGDSAESTATSVAAITNGLADTGDDAVVAIVSSSGVPACTGTVVAPHIVLTAAHCLVPEVLQGGNVVVGTAATSPSASLPIARGIAHPQFDPTSLANDVAILVLAAAAPPPPIPFGTAPPAVGASVDLVGWGETAADAGDFGEKRQGTGVVAQVDAETFGVGSTPSQPCEGTRAARRSSPRAASPTSRASPATAMRPASRARPTRASTPTSPPSSRRRWPSTPPEARPRAPRASSPSSARTALRRAWSPPTTRA